LPRLPKAATTLRLPATLRRTTTQTTLLRVTGVHHRKDTHLRGNNNVAQTGIITTSLKLNGVLLPMVYRPASMPLMETNILPQRAPTTPEHQITIHRRTISNNRVITTCLLKDKDMIRRKAQVQAYNPANRYRIMTFPIPVMFFVRIFLSLFSFVVFYYHCNY
jgi:hypothetical protein